MGPVIARYQEDNLSTTLSLSLDTSLVHRVELSIELLIGHGGLVLGLAFVVNALRFLLNSLHLLLDRTLFFAGTFLLLDSTVLRFDATRGFSLGGTGIRLNDVFTAAIDFAS